MASCAHLTGDRPRNLLCRAGRRSSPGVSRQGPPHRQGLHPQPVSARPFRSPSRSGLGRGLQPHWQQKQRPAGSPVCCPSRGGGGDRGLGHVTGRTPVCGFGQTPRKPAVGSRDFGRFSKSGCRPSLRRPPGCEPHPLCPVSLLLVPCGQGPRQREGVGPPPRGVAPPDHAPPRLAPSSQRRPAAAPETKLRNSTTHPSQPRGRLPYKQNRNGNDSRWRGGGAAGALGTAGGGATGGRRCGGGAQVLPKNGTAAPPTQPPRLWAQARRNGRWVWKTCLHPHVHGLILRQHQGGGHASSSGRRTAPRPPYCGRFLGLEASITDSWGVASESPRRMPAPPARSSAGARPPLPPSHDRWVRRTHAPAGCELSVLNQHRPLNASSLGSRATR